jgi:ribosomal protein RSM22 (predicted rRNA methylase)
MRQEDLELLRSIEEEFEQDKGELEVEHNIRTMEPPDKTTTQEISKNEDLRDLGLENENMSNGAEQSREGAEEPTVNPISKAAQRESSDAKEFRHRVRLYRDIAASFEPPSEVLPRKYQAEDDTDSVEQEDLLEHEYAHDIESNEDFHDNRDAFRAHPLTIAGRFSTSPSTLQLPKALFVNPVTSMLASSSNKHLIEVAERIFGGPGLPNSTATPSSKGHLKQAAIALEASQGKMSGIEADLYLAAIMPGAYATAMSTLVEIRKRLGSKRLEELLAKEGGPLILDVGSGGAGVLAWQEVLAAEWERMHPNGIPEGQPVPLGKATVITGSPDLRYRASRLLQNTTFLPRLPDYLASRDLPVDRDAQFTPRKQYDIIVAPHTLWRLKEDYNRKAQVQNLWSLLNPTGGVLVIIEKGVPRGFELVAGARDVLLKNQISSAGSPHVENGMQNSSELTEKEDGMIIAPCTNHGACPMYTIPGQSVGRKDYCRFSQRYIRPPFLQRILGARSRNHEDIQFSYIAVRRGRDSRKAEGIIQGKDATDAAFAGYEGYEGESPEPQPQDGTGSQSTQPHMLSLPRMLLAPLKRTGHVTIDLCTSAGQLERWTIPKSFSKQAYKDARKSAWGDLWALGAKTRVIRNARAGRGKEGKMPKKRVIQIGLGADESEDTIRELPTKNGMHEKRTKKGRVQRRPRKLPEEDDRFLR